MIFYMYDNVEPTQYRIYMYQEDQPKNQFITLKHDKLSALDLVNELNMRSIQGYSLAELHRLYQDQLKL